MFVTFDDTMKNRPKTFVIVTTAVSRNVCFYRPVRSHRNVLVVCTKIVKIPCGPFFVCSVSFYMSDKLIKNRPKPILHLKSLPLIFEDIVFSATSYVLKKWSYKFQSSYQFSLWTPIKYSLMFVTIDDTRKNGPRTFVIVITAIFWNVYFYRPPRSLRNDLIFCTKNVKRPRGHNCLFHDTFYVR